MTSLPIQVARVMLLFAVLFCAVNVLPVHAQSDDQVADLAARVNRERVMRGLAPLALAANLTAAAQAQAEDVARTGRTQSPQEGHIGSDGSTVFDRVARTGYGAYSWGRRLGENWAWYHSTAEVMAMWMDSAPHRSNILHPLYREMGIGIAPHSAGGFVYVIDFGSQPNVLPIFINDGAGETTSLDVKITLTSEEVAPNGDGDNVGRPIQVMISNTADFAGALWQPFAQTINWTLVPNGGMKTVYVKYRDAKGRTATASASIVFGAPIMPTTAPSRATPTRTPTRGTPRPSAIAMSIPPEMPTYIAMATPTVSATEIATTAPPTATAVIPASVTETASPTPPRTTLSDSGQTVVEPNLAALGAFGITVILIGLSAVKDWAKR